MVRFLSLQLVKLNMKLKGGRGRQSIMCSSFQHWIWIFVLLLISCRNEETISGVSVATGGCHGECQYSAIEIKNDLSYKYYGGDHAFPKGFFTGQISERTWKQIEEQITEKVKPGNLDTAYYRSYDELEVEVIIVSHSGKKRILGLMPDLPTELRALVENICNTPHKLALKRSGSPLAFETVLQYPGKIKDSKFPPDRYEER